MTPATPTHIRPARPTLTNVPHHHEFRPAWTLIAFGLLSAAIAVATRYHHSPWLVAVGIIGPDLSFLKAIGATPLAPGLLAQRAVRPYNLVHTPLTPTIALAIGVVTGSTALTTVAIAWLSHIAWDRGLGYNLRNHDGSIRPRRRRADANSAGDSR